MLRLLAFASVPRGVRTSQSSVVTTVTALKTPALVTTAAGDLWAPATRAHPLPAPLCAWRTIVVAQKIHIASSQGVPLERGRGVTASPSVTGMKSTVGLTWASEAQHLAAACMQAEDRSALGSPGAASSGSARRLLILACRGLEVLRAWLCRESFCFSVFARFS